MVRRLTLRLLLVAPALLLPPSLASAQQQIGPVSQQQFAAYLAGQPPTTPPGIPYANPAALPTQPTTGSSALINGNAVWLDASGLHQMTPGGAILTYAPTSTANAVTNPATGNIITNDATNQPVSNN